MPEHPISSVRDRLVPESLVYVKTFTEGCSSAILEEQIKDWVDKTGNLIVAVGPVSFGHCSTHLAVTYVPAVEGNHDPGKSEIKSSREEFERAGTTGQETVAGAGSEPRRDFDGKGWDGQSELGRPTS